MKLSELAKATKPFPLKNFGTDRAFAKEVQSRLCAVGCLDPKPDGEFGPVSTLGLAAFAKAIKQPIEKGMTPETAKRLRNADPATFLRIKPGSDFAGRVVKYMQSKNYFIARLPNWFTIVYVEGADANGKPNKDQFDKWNDRRLVIAIKSGVPTILFNATATSEPGRHFVKKPINSKGTARIALEQFKAWRVGFHHPNNKPPSRHEALVQCASLKVFRDVNKDGIRTGDKADVGSGFFINQHSGHDQPLSSIGMMSAGCLVGREHAKHKEFMALVKKDPRFRANRGYVFMTAVLDGDDLAKKFPV